MKIERRINCTRWQDLTTSFNDGMLLIGRIIITKGPCTCVVVLERVQHHRWFKRKDLLLRWWQHLRSCCGMVFRNYGGWDVILVIEDVDTLVQVFSRHLKRANGFSLKCTWHPWIMMMVVSASTHTDVIHLSTSPPYRLPCHPDFSQHTYLEYKEEKSVKL